MVPETTNVEPMTIAFCIVGGYGHIVYTDPPDLLSEHPHAEIVECTDSGEVSHYKLENGVYLCTLDEEGRLRGQRIEETKKVLMICDVTSSLYCAPPKKVYITAKGSVCR
jgi:hypothetical protein